MKNLKIHSGQTVSEAHDTALKLTKGQAHTNTNLQSKTVPQHQSFEQGFQKASNISMTKQQAAAYEITQTEFFEIQRAAEMGANQSDDTYDESDSERYRFKHIKPTYHSDPRVDTLLHGKTPNRHSYYEEGQVIAAGAGMDQEKANAFAMEYAQEQARKNDAATAEKIKLTAVPDRSQEMKAVVDEAENKSLHHEFEKFQAYGVRRGKGPDEAHAYAVGVMTKRVAKIQPEAAFFCKECDVGFLD
jgi:hypothetical protein